MSEHDAPPSGRALRRGGEAALPVAAMAAAVAPAAAPPRGKIRPIHRVSLFRNRGSSRRSAVAPAFALARPAPHRSIEPQRSGP
jgi:hypothetical protein